MRPVDAAQTRQAPDSPTRSLNGRRGPLSFLARPKISLRPLSASTVASNPASHLFSDVSYPSRDFLDGQASEGLTDGASLDSAPSQLQGSRQELIMQNEKRPLQRTPSRSMPELAQVAATHPVPLEGSGETHRRLENLNTKCQSDACNTARPRAETLAGGGNASSADSAPQAADDQASTNSNLLAPVKILSPKASLEGSPSSGMCYAIPSVESTAAAAPEDVFSAPTSMLHNATDASSTPSSIAKKLGQDASEWREIVNAEHRLRLAYMLLETAAKSNPRVPWSPDMIHTVSDPQSHNDALLSSSSFPLVLTPQSITQPITTQTTSEDIAEEAAHVNASVTRSPSGSQYAQPATPITSPARRNRLYRAFSSSPSTMLPTSPVHTSARSPRSPRAPRDASTSQPESPGTVRRWTQTLHAILSPSPSLPDDTSPSQRYASHDRRFSPFSSPMLSHIDTENHDARNIVSSVQRAQSDLLRYVRAYCDTLPIDPPVDRLELRASVLFLAQALACGLAVGDLSDESTVAARDEMLHRATLLQQQWRQLRCAIAPGSASHDSRASQIPQISKSYISPLLVLRECLSLRSTVPASLCAESAASAVHSFVAEYRAFGQAIRSYNLDLRKERRKQRTQRRLDRIQQANKLYRSMAPLGEEATYEEKRDDVAVMTSQELLDHALNRTLREGLFSNDDIEAYEPRLLLTLPRMAILYGVQEANFPPWLDLASMTEGCMCTPLEVFLPRLCRQLPVKTIHDIRQMHPIDARSLARRLCGSTSTTPLVPSDETTAATINQLFIKISTEANDGGVGGQAGKNTKLMRKVLQLRLSAGPAGSPSLEENDHEISVARTILATASTLNPCFTL